MKLSLHSYTSILINTILSSTSSIYQREKRAVFDIIANKHEDLSNGPQHETTLNKVVEANQELKYQDLASIIERMKTQEDEKRKKKREAKEKFKSLKNSNKIGKKRTKKARNKFIIHFTFLTKL